MEMMITENPDFPRIDSYESGKITVDGVEYHSPILLHQQVFRLPEDWQPESLTLADCQPALSAGADVLIIGTGQTQRFLPAPLLVALSQNGLGAECMHTAAACRTIMLLQSEGRKVWAWLVV